MRKKSELVSILIPTFNAEKWIAAAVTSALNQTWSNKEIIIVNDGSHDNTLMTARQFESGSVKVLSQENRGASAARNRALECAQGDYIQWLDADNLLAPDKISRQMKAALAAGNRRVLFSSAWARFFYRPWKAQFAPTALWTDLAPREWLYRKLDQNLFMVPETWLVSRELTEAAGPWDERLSLDDDGEYFCRILARSEKIEFVEDAKSYYRSGNLGSLSSVAKRPDGKLASQFTSMRMHISAMLALEDSERTRAACLKFLQRWLIYFYPEKTEIVKQVHALARDLGGSLAAPVLKKKYSLLLRLFGWRITKSLYFNIPAVRLLLRKNCDRLLYALSVNNRDFSRMIIEDEK